MAFISFFKKRLYCLICSPVNDGHCENSHSLLTLAGLHKIQLGPWAVPSKGHNVPTQPGLSVLFCLRASFPAHCLVYTFPACLNSVHHVTHGNPPNLSWMGSEAQKRCMKTISLCQLCSKTRWRWGIWWFSLGSVTSVCGENCWPMLCWCQLCLSWWPWHLQTTQW